MTRAVFLDRDGTLVEPRHYPTHSRELRIYPGVPEQLRHLQERDFALVLVTNQSGIARNYLTEANLAEMHVYLRAKLAKQNVHLDGIYHCPHHPDGVIPDLAVICTCRKPRPGMLHHAAAELALDLNHSWLVGDILDDVEAGNRAGTRTILVDLGTESRPTDPLRQPDFVARDTVHALQIIRAVEGCGGTTNFHYGPDGWRLQPSAGGKHG